MSGRLIILPHKTWHVWKKENIERVKKDERLAREAEEAEGEKQRAVDQERRLNELKHKEGKRKRHPGDKNRGKEKTKSEQGGWDVDGHVNFFAREEREQRHVGGNKDYAKEKKEKELKEAKFQGMAPWALGEGSTELEAKKGKGLWYLEAPGSEGEAIVSKAVVRGKVVTGDEAKEAMDRAQRRKDVDDPLAMLFHSKAKDHPSTQRQRQRHSEARQEKRPPPPPPPPAVAAPPSRATERPEAGGRSCLTEMPPVTKKEEPDAETEGKKQKHKKHKKHKKRKKGEDKEREKKKDEEKKILLAAKRKREVNSVVTSGSNESNVIACVVLAFDLNYFLSLTGGGGSGRAPAQKTCEGEERRGQSCGPGRKRKWSCWKVSFSI
ncbi:unnamed protein product [Chrysoparadoxa australica]